MILQIFHDIWEISSVTKIQQPQDLEDLFAEEDEAQAAQQKARSAVKKMTPSAYLPGMLEQADLVDL